MAPVIVNMTYKYAKTWNDTMGDITDAKIARVDLQLLLLKFNLIYFWVDIVTPLVWEVDLDVRFHVKVSRVIEKVSDLHNVWKSTQKVSFLHQAQ